MAVFGNIRVLDCLNLGYTTDINPLISKIVFNAEASDLTTISTSLSVHTIAGATKGYLTIPSSSGLIIGTTDILGSINSSLDNIRNNADQKTKILTSDNNITFTTAELSVPQGVAVDTTPIIEIKKDVDTRLKTFFNTDIIQNIGSIFETNSAINANQGINIINGDVIVGNGNINVSDDVTVNNNLSVIGTSTQSIINASDKLTISANGLDVTGNSIFNDNLDIDGILNIDATGQIVVDGISTFNNNVTFTSGLVSTTGSTPLTVDGLVTASNGLTVTNGNLQVLSGDVSIMGNLTVAGTTSTIDSTNITMTDNIFVINSGETGAGVTLNTAGMEIDRGSLENYRIVFEEFEENLKFGLISDLKVVALRDDDGNMIDGNIPYWNAIEKRFDVVNGITENEATQLKNINTSTISPTQWAHLGNMDQDVASTSNPTFNNLTVTGVLTASIGVSAMTNSTYNFDNTQINNNVAVNNAVYVIYMQNLAVSFATKFGVLDPPTAAGVVKHFIFIQKNAGAGIANGFVQIRINAIDFNPPYNPPSGTPPTLYTIEFQNVGQSLNLVSGPDNKWYLLNACNCIITDNGIP